MNKEMIMKPMSVARDDFIASLSGLIKNSMLPPFILETILRDTYNEIHILSQRQLEIDRENYAKQMKDSEKSGGQ